MAQARTDITKKVAECLLALAGKVAAGKVAAGSPPKFIKLCMSLNMASFIAALKKVLWSNPVSKLWLLLCRKHAEAKKAERSEALVTNEVSKQVTKIGIKGIW
jgi:hypothetical protein